MAYFQINNRGTWTDQIQVVKAKFETFKELKCKIQMEE